MSIKDAVIVSLYKQAKSLLKDTAISEDTKRQRINDIYKLIKELQEGDFYGNSKV